MRFVDNPPGLREWIALHGLPRVPAAQAAAFLRGDAAPVFGASNASGKQALLDDLHRQGVTVALALERAKPDRSAAQEIYRASLGGTRWMLSVTAHSHPQAPALAPMVELLATIDRGLAASEQ